MRVRVVVTAGALCVENTLQAFYPPSDTNDFMRRDAITETRQFSSEADIACNGGCNEWAEQICFDFAEAEMTCHLF